MHTTRMRWHLEAICAVHESGPRMNFWVKVHINHMNWCHNCNYMYIDGEHCSCLKFIIRASSIGTASNVTLKKTTKRMKLNGKRLVIQFIVWCTPSVCYVEVKLFGETTQRPNENKKNYCTAIQRNTNGHACTG